MKTYRAFCSESSAQNTKLRTKGRISESPDIQPKLQLERCPHACHLQDNAEKPSQLTPCVSAIFLYDKDSPRLAGIIFPLPPVSLAAGIGSPSTRGGDAAPVGGNRCSSSISWGGGFVRQVRDGPEHIPSSTVCSDTGGSLLGI